MFKSTRTSSVWITGALVISGILLGTEQARATAIVANFDDGNSSTEVDAYPGMSGQGWTTAWGTRQNSGATVMATVTNANPMAGGGNYLSVTTTHEETIARSGLVHRRYSDYGSVALAQPHSLSFLYRLDSGIGTTAGRLNIFDAVAEELGPVSSTSWHIRTLGSTITEGGTVAFYHGSGSVSSGVGMYQGDTYLFRLDFDPSTGTFVGYVENLDHAVNSRAGADSFESNALPFMNSLTQPSSRLHFQMSVNPDGGNPVSTSFSLDSIQIIPEPSSVALLLGAGLALALRRRLRA